MTGCAHWKSGGNVNATTVLMRWLGIEFAGADPAGEADPLQRCYLLGFRECLLRLSAFVRDAQPCAHGQLLDALHAYLAARCRPVPPEPASRLRPGLPPPPACPVSPSPASPAQPRHRPSRRPGAPATHAPDPFTAPGPRRRTEEAAASKGEPPQPAVWRPWP
ncbi:hypothetical protein KIL84_008456 [Mauremys mutica]|uniref:Uncharacterized protein n=1 Tax=Mauremys mutica TaxID=74926 RepID=A0A9D3X745_9SAUR|nr:hypothetical protein KIL84_008456 [Mauremys mutica]